MSHNWKKTQFTELALPTTSLQLGLEFTSAVDLIALLWLLSFLNIRFVVRRMYNSFSCHVLLFRPLMCWSGATVWLLEDFSLRTEVEQILSNITRRKARLVFGRFHTASYFRKNHPFLCRRPYRSQSPQTNVPGTRPECISWERSCFEFPWLGSTEGNWQGKSRSIVQRRASWKKKLSPPPKSAFQYPSCVP